jgi:hypothetical protein
MDMPEEDLPDVADAKAADRHDAPAVSEHPLAAAIVNAANSRVARTARAWPARRKWPIALASDDQPPRQPNNTI